jgi:hypothetical protein
LIRWTLQLGAADWNWSRIEVMPSRYTSKVAGLL